MCKARKKIINKALYDIGMSICRMEDCIFSGEPLYLFMQILKKNVEAMEYFMENIACDKDRVVTRLKELEGMEE